MCSPTGERRAEIGTDDPYDQTVDTQVQLTNRHGEALAATWRPADGNGGRPGPAVLLCQGLSGVRNLVLPEVADALAEVGISTLRFDYSGCGESEGARGWIDPNKRVEDARHAFSWLATQTGVDPTRIGVYGHSYGGPVAMNVAASEPTVRAVVAISSPGSGTALLRAARPSWDWVKLRHRVETERAAVARGDSPTVVSVDTIFPFSPAFREAYERLKVSQGGTSAMPGTDGLGTTEFYLSSVDLMCSHRLEPVAARLSHCSTLLISGADDDTAPIEILQPVFDAIPGPKRWHIVPGADHNALDTNPGLAQALNHAADWFTAEFARR